jgi:hypothetical protein
MKIDVGDVVEELRSAGFEAFENDRELLSYRYMIFVS